MSDRAIGLFEMRMSSLIVRKLPTGEYAYSGPHLDQIHSKLVDKEPTCAESILDSVLALSLSLEAFDLRLTGPGDPGPRSIAFKLRSV